MKLLDHGYCDLVEVWGSDQKIIESARMSTDKGFLGWGPKCKRCGDTLLHPLAHCKDKDGNSDGEHEIVPGDEKLLRFLWEKKHATPFEFAGLTVEVQAPIMVFREWHRHRVPFGYSELSARYTPMPDLNYVPDLARLLMKQTANKQASAMKGADVLTPESAEEWTIELRNLYEHAQQVYESGLTRGVPKELARLPVPVGRYSRMRATGNLRGWLAFLTLRMAPDAQYEIRVFANAIGEMVSENFPRTWELFSEWSGTKA